MGVLQTTVSELQQVVDVNKSLYLDSIRVKINTAKRSIINLQNVLMNLKASRLLVQQQMNRSRKREDIATFYSDDRYQNKDHLQSITPEVNYGGVPDSRINYTRNRLLKDREFYQADLNRISSEINRITQELKKQKYELEVNQDKLNVMGKNSQVYVTKDAISKRQYTEVYMLDQIHSKYRQITTNEKGERAYSGNSQYLKMTTKLKNQFTFYAQRSPFVNSGDLVLELDDPGSDFNERSLSSFLERLREVLGNKEFTKYDLEMKKYTEQMAANVTHPFISQNLQRTENTLRVPDSNNALRYSVDTPSKTVNTMIKAVDGINTFLDWDSSTYIAAVISNFTAYVSGLYNMPMCNPIGQSESTIQKQLSDSSQAAIETRSATVFSTELNKTKTLVSSETVATSVSNLMTEITKAIQEDSGKGTPATSSLFVGEKNYVASNLYHVRILNNASNLMTFLRDMLIEGNITQERYDFYVNQLNTYLTNVVSPWL